ncbi:TPA: IS1 family transposase, partial [Shigella flexneri]
LAPLARLLRLLSAFAVVVWLPAGWPLSASRLPGPLPVLRPRSPPRLARPPLPLRPPLARLVRPSLSFSPSVALPA